VSAATVKHLDPTQVELEISISDEELDAARERAFRQLVKNVRIPGFRPGKAPRKIFEAQYGSAGIHERAMESVVPTVYSKALQDNDLEPVDQPQMELLPDEDGQPLRLRATVYVRPQFELQNYKGVALEGASTTVSDSDVEQALEGLRKEAGSLVPVERPVALGDVPTIDYEGKIDGVPFDGGKAEGQATEILEDRFIPGFASGIVGMSAGETKDIEAHFPEGYANTELAGKTAVFTITVHENKVMELADFDDAFAQRFGGPDATVDTLRDEMRNRLEANARREQRRTLAGPLIESLMATHDIALPPVLVDREIDNLSSEAKNYVERAGGSWNDYLEKQGKTEDGLRTEYRDEAEKRVKSTLLLEAIAKAENVTATNADMEAEVQQLSRQYRQPREAIIEMVRSNLGALADGIVRTKTIEFLLDHATITEKPESAPV
jgi:trigger factor